MELVDITQKTVKYKTNTKEEIDRTLTNFTLVSDDTVRNRANKNAQKNIKLHGFRNGKIPLKVLEKQIGLKNLYLPYLYDVWDEFITKENIFVTSNIDITNIHPNTDGSVMFNVITKQIPPVELKLNNHYNIDITEKVLTNVAKKMEHLQNKYITLKEITDKKTPLQWGDVATFSFKGHCIENNALDKDMSGENVHALIGSNTIIIPELEQGLVDMTVNETKTLTCNMPDNLGQLLPKNPNAKIVQGLKAEFTFTLHKIEKRIFATNEVIAEKEGHASYRAFYEKLVMEQTKDLMKDESYLLDGILKNIIEENETIISTVVTPDILDERLNQLLARYQQDLLALPNEEREKTLKNMNENIVIGLYQDIVVYSLMTKFNDKLTEPTDEEIIKRQKEIQQKQQNSYVNKWQAILDLKHQQLFKHIKKWGKMSFNTENETYKNIMDSIPTTTKPITDIIDETENEKVEIKEINMENN